MTPRDTSRSICSSRGLRRRAAPGRALRLSASCPARPRRSPRFRLSAPYLPFEVYRGRRAARPRAGEPHVVVPPRAVARARILATLLARGLPASVTMVERHLDLAALLSKTRSSMASLSFASSLDEPDASASCRSGRRSVAAHSAVKRRRQPSARTSVAAAVAWGSPGAPRSVVRCSVAAFCVTGAPVEPTACDHSTTRSIAAFARRCGDAARIARPGAPCCRRLVGHGSAAADRPRESRRRRLRRRRRVGRKWRNIAIAQTDDARSRPRAWTHQSNIWAANGPRMRIGDHRWRRLIDDAAVGVEHARIEGENGP